MSRFLLSLMILTASIVPISFAEVMNEVHFLIPAGPGGGWDGTARGIGEGLIKSGMVTNVSYENLSGGGGGRAIAKLIETADRQQSTLLVNSSPMVIRSLQQIFPHSFRDLVPIASVISDYTCFVVRKNSPYKTWSDVLEDFRSNPGNVTVAGGSVRGSTDHILFAKAIEMASGNPLDVVYIPYDGGGKAMAGILTGESAILSTGLSEALAMARAGEIRVLAVTSQNRLPEYPSFPTLTEQGYPLVFANWRGFFAAKGIQDRQYSLMKNTLREFVNTKEFDEIRIRNGWFKHYLEGPDFQAFLVKQEAEIGKLMHDLGFLRPL